MFQTLCLPVWFIVISIIYLMLMAAWIGHEEGYQACKIDEFEKKMEKEEKIKG